LADWGWSTPEEIKVEALTPSDKVKLVRVMKRKMNEAAKNWEFEKAAEYRDMVEKLER
jgi:excinuclease UvrABC helicase subunit UvrB